MLTWRTHHFYNDQVNARSSLTNNPYAQRSHRDPGLLINAAASPSEGAMCEGGEAASPSHTEDTAMGEDEEENGSVSTMEIEEPELGRGK